MDLSEAPLRGNDFTALHKAVLDSLRRAASGILSREELLDKAKGYSLSEIVRVLRDLSVRGLVNVLWRSPFRFFAFATERGRAGSPLPANPVRTLPS